MIVGETMDKQHYEESMACLLQQLQEAGAVLIGAGGGMPAASGQKHYYESDDYFTSQFGDFAARYGFSNTNAGLEHAYPSTAARWGFWARLAGSLLHEERGQAYKDLWFLVNEKPLHVITTNQDAQFYHIFPDAQISTIAGDWRYLQCSEGCVDMLFPARNKWDAMSEALDEALCVPEALLPRCPVCRRELRPWIPGAHFLEGSRLNEEYDKINRFLERCEGSLLILELGTGGAMTPLIRTPLQQLAAELPEAFYVAIGTELVTLPKALASRGLVITGDLGAVLADAKERLMETKEGAVVWMT